MSWLARAGTMIALVATLNGVAAIRLRAQAAAAPLPAPVETMFADASAKEAAVRKALATSEPLSTLLKAVRTVVADYENVVRHYPASGYADDALWRAARLARDGFDEFGEARERATALRLFQLLASQYPTSRLARATPEQIAWLNAHPPKAPVPVASARVRPALPAPGSANAAPGAPPVVPATAPASAGASAKVVSVMAVRRAVLADIVRVVIELDDEVAFRDERVDNPSRLLIDLPSARPVGSLTDHTFRFDADTDIVRQVRVGRPQDGATRVVIETAGVSSYSVYPLYSPYRLVIDCMRGTPSRALDVPPSVPPPAAPSRQTLNPMAGSPTSGRRPSAPVTSPTAMASRTAQPVAVPPPLLASRAIIGLVPLASGAGTLADTTQPAADARSTPLPTLPSRPVAPQVAPRVAAPPSRNIDGGLSMARQLGLGVSRIVIDPGHGGHDPGAKGPSGTEADLVLDVALRLEKLLVKLPGVEVVLTRRENEFVALQERTAIANREGADLFLSIHANASSNTAARGVETYFLNFASNQSAAAVAARENATSGQTMGALQDVVKAIALNSKLDESRDFATYVQREMLESLRSANKSVKDLGVKQAPFVVLIGAAMPSVLAEISFITNPQEATLLKGNGYRQRVAQALFDGIKEYQSSLKRVPAIAQQQN